LNPTELTKWRKQNNHTQISLGKALGVSTITVYRWEKGMRAIPSFLHLALKYLAMKGGELKTQDREGNNKNSMNMKGGKD